MRKKEKKGFTLAEMSVAMAIIAVAMSMLALCFVSINAFAEKKERQHELTTEILGFETAFSEILRQYPPLNNTLLQNQTPTNSITLQTSTETITISYTQETKAVILWPSEQIIYTFKQIDGVKFSTYEKLIKVELAFDKTHRNLVFFT